MANDAGATFNNTGDSRRNPVKSAIPGSVLVNNQPAATVIGDYEDNQLVAEDDVIINADVVSSTTEYRNVSLTTPSTPSNIPASGGNVRILCTLSYEYRTVLTYSNNSTNNPSWNSYSEVLYGNYVGGNNLGTTVTSRTKLGTSSISRTINGVNYSRSADIYLEANTRTSTTDETINGTPVLSNTSGITAAGGSCTINCACINITNGHYTYTSGATEGFSNSTNVTCTLSMPTTTRFSLSGNTLTHSSMTSNLTTDSATVTATSTSGTTASITIQVTNYIIGLTDCTLSCSSFTLTAASGNTLSKSVTGTGKYLYASGYKSSSFSTGVTLVSTTSNQSYISASFNSGGTTVTTQTNSANTGNSNRSATITITGYVTSLQYLSSNITIDVTATQVSDSIASKIGEFVVQPQWSVLDADGTGGALINTPRVKITQINQSGNITETYVDYSTNDSNWEFTGSGVTYSGYTLTGSSAGVAYSNENQEVGNISCTYSNNGLTITSNNITIFRAPNYITEILSMTGSGGLINGPNSTIPYYGGNIAINHTAAPTFSDVVGRFSSTATGSINSYGGVVETYSGYMWETTGTNMFAPIGNEPLDASTTVTVYGNDTGTGRSESVIRKKTFKFGLNLAYDSALITNYNTFSTTVSTSVNLLLDTLPIGLSYYWKIGGEFFNAGNSGYFCVLSADAPVICTKAELATSITSNSGFYGYVRNDTGIISNSNELIYYQVSGQAGSENYRKIVLKNPKEFAYRRFYITEFNPSSDYIRYTWLYHDENNLEYTTVNKGEMTTEPGNAITTGYLLSKTYTIIN